jgi:uncharacterized protein (TIGR00297 family)
MNNLPAFYWIPEAGEASKLWIPALVSLVFAAFGRLVRGVTTRGALAGAIVCFTLLVGADARGFLTLLTVFLLTWVCTRVGYARKQNLGTAERCSGRNAAQVAANLGVASFCAMLYAVAWRDSRLLLALAAALAEAAADTVSSEIGQAVGGTPRLITNWKPVPAGTDGAITLAGTAAGFTAAIAVSLTALAPTANFPAAAAGWHTVLLCAFAAVAGMSADSLLGATLERRGILGNNSVNFTSTAIAAATAIIITLLV